VSIRRRQGPGRGTTFRVTKGSIWVTQKRKSKVTNGIVQGKTGGTRRKKKIRAFRAKKTTKLELGEGHRNIRDEGRKKEVIREQKNRRENILEGYYKETWGINLGVCGEVQRSIKIRQ